MNPHKRFTFEVEQEIVKRYTSGERSGALAKEYKCDRATISKIAKRHGHTEYASTIKGGVRGINTSSENERIRALHAEGLSQAAIGKAVGISQCVVSRVFRQMGLVPNNIPNSRKGKDSNFYKCGRVIMSGGYVGILAGDEFPEMRSKSGYILEHRLAMARHLGRALSNNETVHHIDGDRGNNRIENLQLRNGKHGKGVKLICANCGSCNISSLEL